MTDLDQAADLPALRRGDKFAWDAFVPPAAALIKAVVRRNLCPCGHEHEVPDVVQEVFTRLSHQDFKLLRQFDPLRAKLSTWLGVIASAAAVDFLRRVRVREVSLEDAEPLLIAAPDVDRHRPLTLPADLLSARQMLILSLLYEFDLTPQEVAQQLHIDAQTVRSQRHKAFQKLRQLWGPAPSVAAPLHRTTER